MPRARILKQPKKRGKAAANSPRNSRRRNPWHENLSFLTAYPVSPGGLRRSEVVSDLVARYELSFASDQLKILIQRAEGELSRLSLQDKQRAAFVIQLEALQKALAAKRP